MSTPPIKSFSPKISPDVPWEQRVLFQQIFQKLGNHTQAFSLQQQKINALKPGSTTTNIVESGGSGPAPPSSVFLGQGLINDQSGATGYATAPGDNGILLILNDASPVAVSLTTDAAPFYLIITNFGAGIATLTPSTGTINGGASLSLLQNQTVLACCDSTNWSTTAFVTAQSKPAVAHEWLASYSAATGAFTQTQPAFADISGNLATSQLPAAGITATIATAKLTVGGTNGSMTLTNGILTAQTPAT